MSQSNSTIKTLLTTFFKPQLTSFLNSIDEKDEDELVLLLEVFNDIIDHIKYRPKLEEGEFNVEDSNNKK